MAQVIIQVLGLYTFSLGLSKSQSIPIYGISALEAIAISQREFAMKVKMLWF